MILNRLGRSGIMQDLAGYAETDPNSHIAVTIDRVTLANLNRDESAYLRKDFGANWFDLIRLDFTIYANSTSGNESMFIMGFSNNVAGWGSWGTPFLALMWFKNTSAQNSLTLWTDWSTYDASAVLSANTPYYISILRGAGLAGVTVLIYSDSARTTLVDTITANLSATATKFRYLFAACSTDDNNATPKFNGYAENFILR
jgi:hypothetical protein